MAHIDPTFNRGTKSSKQSMSKEQASEENPQHPYSDSNNEIEQVSRSVARQVGSNS